MEILRKMNSIITASQMNKNARAHCEKCFLELKELGEFDVSSIHCNEHGHEKVLNSLPNVLNPLGSRQKALGIRDLRVLLKINRKSKKLSKNAVSSSTAPSQITLSMFNHLSLVPQDQHRAGEGSFPLPPFHPTYYFHSANSSSVFMPVMAPPVLQQLHSNVIHANDSYNDKH
ncbi:hypothetical protein Cgig2_004319 [Carnegiea gigantea]|uniref:Uncharacterized protein n=1 Tax=Carnegiea gigantea TaxID=171969 RepID=A0A9Q1GPJ2_9CARY|nr:hypothetical protein Cgig2_004319 [Carnegiea gigantea]